uniref:Uncharacterized protein n=1 Tax=Macrostomum lignano TaxID=282301 RepID=A0A1I8F4M9_9PLAT
MRVQDDEPSRSCRASEISVYVRSETTASADLRAQYSAAPPRPLTKTPGWPQPITCSGSQGSAFSGVSGGARSGPSKSPIQEADSDQEDSISTAVRTRVYQRSRVSNPISPISLAGQR